MDASPDMRDKRELIEKFIQHMTPEKGADVSHNWEKYIEQEKRKQLSVIIEEENLKAAETEDFMERAFADGYVTETGTGITNILPPSNPFLPESGEKKQTVIEKLKAYLNKFSNMLSDDSAGLDVFRKRKLNNVEEDEDMKNFIIALVNQNPNITDLGIQREVIERYGQEYPAMTNSDWNHIIRPFAFSAVQDMRSKVGEDVAEEIPLNYSKAADPLLPPEKD